MLGEEEVSKNIENTTWKQSELRKHLRRTCTLLNSAKF